MTPFDAKRPLQLNDQGQLRHFLSLDGLPRELLTEILDTADSFTEVGARAVKSPLLRGKTVCNVFFENSTRTRTTFELAAQRLSADVISLNVSTSSTSKGETLFDTLRNLEAMAADMFVVRHSDSGAAHFIAEHVCPEVAVINGGDGRHAHPTQGMLDMLTIRRHKGSFENLSVAIVGDILHSRVARSDMLALKALGCPDIRVVGPKTLIPVGIEQYGVKVYTDLAQGLKDVDVVIMLRLQRERMAGGLLPSEGEFYRLFGLTTARLAGAKPDAIVMHPGPINRGVEIESAVADGQHSVILNQVTYGIAVRMAVLSMAMSGQTAQRQFDGERPVTISIIGARVIDPASGLDTITDLHLDGGRIAAIGAAPAGFTANRTIQADGLVAAGPGRPRRLLREPGYSRKGNIASETRAAVAGGVTSLCCPPQTKPVLDTSAVAELILDRAREAANSKVYPIGALTKGLEGEQLAELVALRDTGCVAFGNGLKEIPNNRTLARALEYAATFDLTVVFHSQDRDLAQGGLAHEARWRASSACRASPRLPRPWPWRETYCWSNKLAYARTSARSPAPAVHD